MKEQNYITIYDYYDNREMFQDFSTETVIYGDDMEGFNKAMASTMEEFKDPKNYTLTLVATSYDDICGATDSAVIAISTKKSHIPLGNIGIKYFGELLDKALQLPSMNDTKVKHVDNKYHKTYGSSSELTYI